MDWKDEWPGEPYRVAEPGRDSDDEPFRVSLTQSACEAAEAVATLRDTAGDVVTYDSRADAVEELLHAVDRPGLSLQRPAPNDPTDVDAYLVHRRDPPPPPDDRGSPTAGWTFDVRAQQVGALAEALFGAYRRDPPPIRAYAARDLDIEPEAIRVVVEDDPSPVGGLHPGDGGRWVPDFAFAVRRRTDADPAGDDGAVLRQYYAEVKHGSTSFERDQRGAMVRVAERGPRVDALVIRVDLSGVPRSYGLSIRSVSLDGFGG